VFAFAEYLYIIPSREGVSPEWFYSENIGDCHVRERDEEFKGFTG
jgi:hypothetical protein